MAGGGTRGILHGVSLSPYVRKVRAVLAIKGIAYDLVNVMPGAMDPEFLAKSPLSKIPVWEEEDGWTLPDSSVICAYLERVEPRPAFYPSEPRAFADALFWEEYADTRLVESVEPVFFQRIVRGRFFRQSPDEAIIRRQTEEILPPVFDQIETLFIEAFGITRDAPVTIATLSIWAPFVNLEHAGFDLDAKTWPGIAAFLDGMNDRRILREIVEAERAAMAALEDG
ncbi:MAG TPA: glutathione S-transferase family protein [Deltaproteobacteria bacterium]|nr:glutathione S-transferase family protein [Deltaproteobacteria bacterium]